MEYKRLGEFMKEPLLYKILRPVITLFFKCIFHPTYIGKEYISKKGRIVLCGNHTNYLDCIFLISSTKRTIHFLAKDSLYKGYKKWLFKPMGIIPVNRKIHDKEALNKAKEYLKEEKAIGIFPEGTISKDKNKLLPFKYGCVKMAKDTNSLVVPFIITGKYRIGKNKLKIEFLKPYKITKDLTEENENLRKTIENKRKEEL